MSRLWSPITLSILACVVVDTGALATPYPSPTTRYMKSGVQLCDQGSFFVDGALKTTSYVRRPRAPFPTPSWSDRCPRPSRSR